MTMVSFLMSVVVVALAAAFVILLAMKVGIIEWMQARGDKLVSDLASCHFCMSFWTGTILFVIMAVVYDDPLLVFGGMFSCPITRMLL